MTLTSHDDQLAAEPTANAKTGRLKIPTEIDLCLVIDWLNLPSYTRP
jgi:hypothetical protein